MIQPCWNSCGGMYIYQEYRANMMLAAGGARIAAPGFVPSNQRPGNIRLAPIELRQGSVLHLGAPTPHSIFFILLPAAGGPDSSGDCCCRTKAPIRMASLQEQGVVHPADHRHMMAGHFSRADRPSPQAHL